ncbi:hypothetical protein K1719_023071 [Acacia pycnantha]|nr:hypothetical protein K1719_023071 [Acacia pycnantha]
MKASCDQLRSPLGKTQQWQKRQNCDYRAVIMSYFFKAFNVAAAAATTIECAKLWGQLEEERELVQRLKQVVQRLTEDLQRLKQEKEDEAEMAQKDVEYATARADVAENEWIKLKRELREARELVQLLNPEGEETRQIVLRQGDDKELELANALNTASVAESECDKLRALLEEERKLVQRLIVEKEDGAQLGKRQIEEIGQELADARKDAEYSTARADAAESKCAILERILIEEGKTVRRLVIEKDNEAEQAKQEIEKMGRELACARKEDQYAHNDADITERECAELERLLEEEKKLARRLILEKDDESECANLERMLIEEGKTVQRLITEKDDEAEWAKRKIEKMGRELACARSDADIAENEWTKVKREVKEKEELIKLLKLEIQETRQDTMRQVEEISQELEEARNEAEQAQYDADIAQGNYNNMLRAVLFP